MSSMMIVHSVKYGAGDGSHREVEVFPALRQRMVESGQPLLFLPKGDEARLQFLQPGVSDPAPGVKKVFTINHCMDIEESEVAFLYMTMTTRVEGEDRLFGCGLWNEAMVKSKLASIHQGLCLRHGKLEEEVPEQLILTSFLSLVLRFLPVDELNVLEIGGNMGRATMVTRRILTTLFGVQELKPVIRHAVMETFPSIAAQLRENLDLNQMLHEIEIVESTLNDDTRFGLIQTNWNITSFDLSLPHEKFHFQKSLQATLDKNNAAYKTSVKSISWTQLCEKYFQGSAPELWIVDCEGFFFNIVTQFPVCLQGMQMLVIENDFATLDQKKVVDSALRQNGLYDLITFAGGLQSHACKQQFYQVWVKRNSPLEQQLRENIELRFFNLVEPDEFEMVSQDFPTDAAESKVSTNRPLEKKQISPEVAATAMFDFHDLPISQQIDFARETAEVPSADREHEFTVYSIVGCTNCDKLMYEAQLLADEVQEAYDEDEQPLLSLRVRKIDVTSYVRNRPEGKEEFTRFLKEQFGYVTSFSAVSSLNAKPQEQRMSFPIVIYNRKYLGGADSASKKLKRMIGDFLDDLRYL